MQQKERPRILVVGAGAIGAFYGAILARQNAEVSVIARSEIEYIRTHGYSIKTSLGDRIFRPYMVLDTVKKYGLKADYILVTLKVLDGIDRAELFRDAVGPNTVIALLENGINIEEEIQSSFPANELLSIVAYTAISKLPPNNIHHTAYGHLAIGNFPRGVSSKAKELACMFESGGIRCALTENIVAMRWQKCVWNAVINPISVLHGCKDTQNLLADAATEQLIRTAMNEVLLVASAAGHYLPKSIIDLNIKNTKAMAPHKTSMANDYMAGRPMEVEAILGNVVRCGRKSNINMPVLEMLYTSLVQLK